MVKRLDRAMSIYVRKMHADKSGRVECFTCRRKLHWKKADAGHFQSRAKWAIRWDTRYNVKPQCKPCNMRSGEQYKFARRLDEIYGPGTALRIEQEGSRVRRYTLEELEQMATEFTALTKKGDPCRL